MACSPDRNRGGDTLRGPTHIAGDLIVAACASLIAIGLCFTSPIRAYENFLADLRISHHPVPFEPHDQIVIIAIDDATMKDVPYSSPIHRGVLASVLQGLDTRNARLIALDVLLDMPTEPELDDQLSETMAGLKADLVLVSDPGTSARNRICGGGNVGEAVADSIRAQFRQHAVIAHGTLCVDSLDGVVRKTGAPFDPPSFANASARGSDHRDRDTDQRLTIDFRPGSQFLWPFPTYSASVVGALPTDWIEGKTVLIGAIQPYSNDFLSSPLRFSDRPVPVEPAGLFTDGQLPGVVVHAYALATLISGQDGRADTPWLQLPFVLLGSVIGLLLLSRNLPVAVTLLALLVSLAGFWWAIFALHGASDGYSLFPYFGFAISLVLTSGALFAVKERDQRQRRRMIEAGFGQFLSQERVRQIIDDPALLARTAEERDITVLFTDLAGFTQLVDTLPPDDLAPLLNDYLDIIVDCVVQRGGTVDKIVGDAVHAFFSAPIEMPDHREQALHCALEIEQRTEAFRQSMRSETVILGESRIGIATGRALVGNFGSSKRFDYTAHGSVVNLAARLEAENKRFGTRICVAQSSLVHGDDFGFRPIGAEHVRGFSAPVEIYELTRSDKFTPDARDAYRKAFALYDTDPDGAIALFEDVLRQQPDDPLIAYQITRLRIKKAE